MSDTFVRPVRQIRQVVDPATLRTNPNDAIREQGAAASSQYTQAVIQKRLEEQQRKAAEAEQRRQQQLLLAQQRAAQTTEKRNADYQARLNKQMAALQSSFAKGLQQQQQVTLDPEAYSSSGHTAAYDAALARANKEVVNPSRDWTRDCQMFARTPVRATAFGTTALKAWQTTPDENKHYTYPPRPGSIAYYANPKNPGAGHAVFVGDNGKVYSTDIKRTGKIDIVNWNVFQTKWNMAYLGWIDATPSGKLPVQGGSR